MVRFTSITRVRHRRKKLSPRLPQKAQLMLSIVALICRFCVSSAAPSEHHFSKLKRTEYTEFEPFDWFSEPNEDKYIEFSCPAPLLKPLFIITRFSFMSMMNSKPLPKGYIQFDKWNTRILGPKLQQRNEWGDLMQHHWMIILILVILVAIGVAVPIVGLYICIRECFEGDKDVRDDTDSKRDRRDLIVCNVLLGILTIGILFGFVGAFVTSNFLELSEKDYKAATLASAFFAKTSRDVNRILITNYTQISFKMQRTLHVKIDYITDQLKMNSMEKSRAFLKNYQDNRQNIQSKLENMLNIVNPMFRPSQQLSDMLRGVRWSFSRDYVKYANGESENNFKYYIEKYDGFQVTTLGDNGIERSSLPRIKTALIDLKTFYDTPLLTDIGNMDKISTYITKTFEELSTKEKEIVDVLGKSGDSLKKAATDIQIEMIKSIDLITADTVIDDLQLKYDPYRFCVGLVVGSVLLLIWICLMGALICGLCGKKSSNGGRNKCFNRSDGAFFLMGVSVLIFAFAALLALSAVGHLLPGILAYGVYCNPQSNFVANGSRLFDYTITECRKNKPIFAALNAKEKRINFDEFKKNVLDFNTILDQLVNLETQLEEPPSIQKNAKDRKKFERLQKSKALIKFEDGRFIDKLESKVLIRPLESLFDRNYINSHSASGPIVKRGIATLNLYATSIAKKIISDVNKLKDLSHQVQILSIYDQYNLRESIQLFIQEQDEALKFLAETKCWTCFVRSAVHDLSLSLRGDFDRYASMIVESTDKSEKTEDGSCYQLAAAFDAYQNSICCAFVDLINGFWVSILWCLLLFIPILWVAFRLANLYHRLDPYTPDQYQEVTKLKEPKQSQTKAQKETAKPPLPPPSQMRRLTIISRDNLIGSETGRQDIRIRRSTSEPRKSFEPTRASIRPKETVDIQRISIQRNKSRTSASSSSSSDIDLVIQRRKSKKD